MWEKKNHLPNKYYFNLGVFAWWGQSLGSLAVAEDLSSSSDQIRDSSLKFKGSTKWCTFISLRLYVTVTSSAREKHQLLQFVQSFSSVVSTQFHDTSWANEGRRYRA
ncbi:hypothetical protein CEXT_718041 [Caerostris extrusa]|uniref:Uncharacterized protein n=1 Tax=Caerostris extrusa TaxID=172846 RepID=A0AAV4USV6_CAEEX|nr:hypothetical protein CEXT_718041 [Caerostris extrusa]